MFNDAEMFCSTRLGGSAVLEEGGALGDGALGAVMGEVIGVVGFDEAGVDCNCLHPSSSAPSPKVSGGGFSFMFVREVVIFLEKLKSIKVAHSGTTPTEAKTYQVLVVLSTVQTHPSQSRTKKIHFLSPTNVQNKRAPGRVTHVLV